MGERVTDHADTIRRLAEAAQREADQVYAPQPPIHTAQQQFYASVTPTVVLALLAERQQAIDALRELEPMQQRVLAGFEKHGIVFDRAPSVNPDPSDWQQVAFSIYTSLCEVDSIVSAALVSIGEQVSDTAPTGEATQPTKGKRASSDGS